jgi:hypothetical protein
VEERVPDFLVEAFESAVEVVKSALEFFVAVFDAALDFSVAAFEANLNFFVDAFEAASLALLVRVAREWRVVTGESWERVWPAGDTSP